MQIVKCAGCFTDVQLETARYKQMQSEGRTVRCPSCLFIYAQLGEREMFALLEVTRRGEFRERKRKGLLGGRR